MKKRQFLNLKKNNLKRGSRLTSKINNVKTNLYSELVVIFFLFRKSVVVDRTKHLRQETDLDLHYI